LGGRPLRRAIPSGARGALEQQVDELRLVGALPAPKTGVLGV
jgi:hypothetical protein